jgi:hypothetical protein
MNDLTTAQIIGRIARGDVLSGLKNCHIKNIHSLVFKERTNEYWGMNRLFYAAKGHSIGRLFGEGGDFCLLPHNHRQSISIELLFGQVSNLRFFDADHLTLPCFEYHFDSAVLGGNGSLQSMRSVKISAPSWERLVPGCPIKLEWNQVHGMVVHSEVAAWIVREGFTAPSTALTSVLTYSMVPEKKLDMRGLYEPMDASTISKFCREIINATAL